MNQLTSTISQVDELHSGKVTIMVTAKSTTAKKPATKPVAKKTTATAKPTAKVATSKTATAKTTAKPAVKKTATTSKAVAAPAAEKKPATRAKVAPAKAVAAAPSPEQRYRMVQDAAYFLAEKNGFQGGAMDYWIAAEIEVAAALSGKE